VVGRWEAKKELSSPCPSIQVGGAFFARPSIDNFVLSACRWTTRVDVSPVRFQGAGGYSHLRVNAWDIIHFSLSLSLSLASLHFFVLTTD
jgi:hypothetical protein